MTARRASIRKAFAAAARDYDANARVQRDVADRLAARVAALDLPAPRMLEIGCGTGLLTSALAARGLSGEWTITDIAPEMVAQCQARLASLGADRTLRFAVLDGERGVPDGRPFDLICSSLAAQWFDDAPAALRRMAQWLAPGGHLLVTTLGAASFAEWRDAHAAEGLAAGTPGFLPAEHFAALLPKALLVEDHIEHHADARAFLRAVKAIGAGTSAPEHRTLTPTELRRVMARFDRSGCKVTYQVVTCHLHRAR